jgi:hypothetical protein
MELLDKARIGGGQKGGDFQQGVGGAVETIRTRLGCHLLLKSRVPLVFRKDGECLAHHELHCTFYES